jgi:hypothetical protein
MANIDSNLSEAQVTQITNEVISRLSKAGVLTVEVGTPGKETYFKKFAAGSFVHADPDGNLSIAGHNAELSPTLGNLNLASTGVMKISSGHALVISAEDGMKTGGGSGGTQDAAAVTIMASGDVHIESTGPGGIFIKSPKDLRLEGDNVKIVGKTSVSINTGSQEPVASDIPLVGSGDLSITTGRVQLSTREFTEQTLSLKNTVNTGHVLHEQRINPLEPTIPQQHLTSTTTVGSLEHDITGDYIVRVGGKMLLQVAGLPIVGSPLNGVGSVQLESYLQEISGDRAAYIVPGLGKPPGGGDFVNILGPGAFQVNVVAPDETGTAIGFNAAAGDVVTWVDGAGNVAMGTTAGDVSLDTLAGDVTLLGTHISMVAETEVRALAPLINLN